MSSFIYLIINKKTMGGHTFSTKSKPEDSQEKSSGADDGSSSVPPSSGDAPNAGNSNDISSQSQSATPSGQGDSHISPAQMAPGKAHHPVS